MKRFLKYTLITLLALPLLAAAFLWGLYLTADMEPPAMTVDTAAYRVADHGGYTSCRGSFLRHNRYGLWELYTAGSPEESGAAAGALTAGLMDGTSPKSTGARYTPGRSTARTTSTP